MADDDIEIVIEDDPRTSDSFPLKVNGKLCRAIRDERIWGRLPDPDLVW